MALRSAPPRCTFRPCARRHPQLDEASPAIVLGRSRLPNGMASFADAPNGRSRADRFTSTSGCVPSSKSRELQLGNKEMVPMTW